jgi:hypothetical protein
MRSTPITGDFPALPSSVPLDITGAPVPQSQTPAAPDHLPPQLASAARMALAIAQRDNEQKREAVTDDPDFRKAAAWLRGKSSQRILIELVMRISKLEDQANGKP